MVVCRFFLEGRCRFGENCYNEHIDPNRGYRAPAYNERQRFDSSQNYDRFSSPHPNDRHRYESPQYREQNYDNHYNTANPRTGGFKRDNFRDDYDQYHWQSPKYDSRNSNVQLNVPVRNSFTILQNENTQPRYDESNRSRRSQYQNEPVHRTTSQNEFAKNNIGEDVAHLNVIREEVAAWEMGQQWPFSVYAPIGVPAPDFQDISPEEMRFQAYESEKNHNFDSYVKFWSDSLTEVNKKRQLLKDPKTAADFLNKKADVFFKPQPTVSSQTFSFNKALSSTSASNVFFGNTTAPKVEEASNIDTVNVSSGLFGKPAANPLFDSPTSTSTSDTIYSLLESLTKEELDEFSSPTFTLGKIPTRPPPKSLCF